MDRNNVIRPEYQGIIEHTAMHALMGDADIAKATALLGMMSFLGVGWQDVMGAYLETRPSLLAQMKTEAEEWPEDHQQIFEEFLKTAGLREANPSAKE